MSASPGVRYWIRESYGRSYFLGIHGVSTMYNVGGVLAINIVTKATVLEADFLWGTIVLFLLIGI